MRSLTASSLLILAALPAAAQTIGFEAQGLPANSFRNNAGGAANGFFAEQGALFNNSFDPAFGGIWSGWAVSSVTDNATPGFGNQYAAIPGGGARGSANYGVGFAFGDVADPRRPDSSFVNLPGGVRATAIDITNTAYAYFSRRDGDAFSRQFAAGDFLRLTITGYQNAGGAGTATGAVDVFLADFRTGPGTLLASWLTVDLNPLGNARSLRFALESTDFGAFGINTPAYFAADNLTLVSVPEPGSLALIAAAGLAFAWRRRQSKASG